MTEEELLKEEEWLAGKKYVGSLVEFVFFDTPTSDRKLRLFSCACSRRIVHLIGDDVFAKLLAVAEAHADGEVNDEALKAENTILRLAGKRSQASNRQRQSPLLVIR